MKEFGKKLEVNIFFDLRSNVKVKVMNYHYSRPYLAYVSLNNNFSVWDYEKKTCLKSFNVNLLESKDLTRGVVIKEIKFYDKDTLSALFPYEDVEASTDDRALFYKNNWLICVAENKIYFYDYVCEKIEQISPLMLDNKIPRCVEIIDTRYLAIGCSDGLVKIFDTLTWSIPKTLKGYHRGNISNILAYQQNEGSRNRLIVASNDGTMACWNADTDGPQFRFQMLKNGKPIGTANNLEDITSVSYNRQSNQLLTCSEHYITVWSSLVGNEIIRYKNPKDSAKNPLIGAHYLYNGEINKDFVLCHGKGTELLLMDVTQGLKVKDKESVDTITLFDFKTLRDFEKDFRIYFLRVHYMKPQYVFLATSLGVFILNIGSQLPSLCNFASNPFYTTYITPVQVKEFLNEDGSIKKLNSQMIQKCQSYELPDIGTRLPNILLLSVTNQLIQCHLIDRTKFDSLQGSANITAKTILHKIEELPVFEDEPEVQVSMSGKYFSVWYKKSGILNIFAITNKNIIFSEKNENLIELDNLHPCGSVTKLYSGAAKSFAWHQDKDEFAILAPVDKEGKLVEAKEKIESISKGFFAKKTTKTTLELDPSTITSIILLVISINQLAQNKIQCEIVYKNDTFKMPTKIFGGPFYAISDRVSEEDFQEMMKPELEAIKRDIRSVKTRKINFFQFKDSKFAKVGTAVVEPLHVFWNLAGTICILAYELNYIVYRVDENHQLLYYGEKNRSILSGYFWENIFFYITETTIHMAIFDLKQGIIDICLAADQDQPNLLGENFLDEYFVKDGNFVEDSIFPLIQLRPHGHLKIVGLYDYKLLLVNSREEFFTIELYHPFTRILMCLQFENIREAMKEVDKIDPKNYHYLYELFSVYGFQGEAEEILGKVKDKEVLAICGLKNSFYDDARYIFDNPDKKPILNSNLIDHFALDGQLIKSKGDLSEAALFNIEKLNGFDVSNKEERSQVFIRDTPGIEFYLTQQIGQKNRDLKPLLKKLAAL